MIRLHTKASLIGVDGFESRVIPWAGQSANELLELAVQDRPEWLSVELAVGVNGALVTGDELDLALPDDCDVVIAPNLLGIVEIVVGVVIGAILSAGISYISSLLIPPPAPPGVPQQRGEESSPTYSWQGIQTSYGQGLPVPIAYGEHDIGGQVIYTNVFSSTAQGSQTENLELILALSEGRCESIGGVTGGTLGEANMMGEPGKPFPSNVRINENALVPQNIGGVRGWLRMGELDQSVLPAPFGGATTTFSVSERLNTVEEAIFTISSSERKSFVAAVIAFPAGLYVVQSSGGIGQRTVDFQMSWRHVGEQSWRGFWLLSGIGLGTISIRAAQIGFYSATITGYLVNPSTPEVVVDGPIEVRLRRTVAAGPSAVVDQAVWRQCVVNFPGEFAYPRVALLGLQIPASEKFSGGLPNIVVRGKWKRVRVWDPSLGWSPRTWEGTEAAFIQGGFSFHKYAPGNNPAWVLLDFLLDSVGLGHWIKEENVDLLSFRQWAIYCDQEPGPGGSQWSEPRYRFDGVIDRARPAWEWVLAICRAGGAAPIIRGNQISIRYEFRDSHSDAGVSPRMIVPAKARTQLFTDANVDELQVEYLNRGKRPTVVDYQFLNAGKDYRQDVYPVEETESYLDYLSETPPLRTRDFRRETEQAFGVARSTQLFRMGVFKHRVNRLVRKIISFRTGIWALAADAGDLIGFQHDVLRPFSSNSLGLVIKLGGSQVTEVTVNRQLALSGGTDKLVMRVEGGIAERQVTAIDSTGYVLTLDQPVSVNGGAAAAFGQQGAIVEDYEILSADLSKDGLRRVRAIQWVPAIFDEPATGTGGDSAGAAYADSVGPGQSDSYDAPAVIDADDVRLEPDPDTPGYHRVTWTQPPSRQRYAARVYARPQGAETWWSLGEVRSEDSELPWYGFVAGETWEIAVSMQDDRGVFQMPDELTAKTVTVEEFPRFSPPDVQNVRVDLKSDGWLLRWNHLEDRSVDRYEVRLGTAWVGGRVVYAGRDPFFHHVHPPKNADSYWIAARTRSGLYSRVKATKAVPAAFHPIGRSAATADIDEMPPLSSLPTELVYDSGVGGVKLQDGYRIGTYTGTDIDIGSDQLGYWSVGWDLEERDAATVDDLLGLEVDGGEMRWRTVYGREASPASPGISWWQRTVDDLPTTVDAWSDEMTAGGWRGDAGSHSSVKIESRFHIGGSWQDWGEHYDGWRVARAMQARYTLGRDGLKGNAYLKRLDLAVST